MLIIIKKRIIIITINNKVIVVKIIIHDVISIVVEIIDGQMMKGLAPNNKMMGKRF